MVKDKARTVMSGAVAERLTGGKPGVMRAGATAVVAGGITGVVVFRLLRRGVEED